MKYCEDDINKAHSILYNIKFITNDIKEFYILMKLNDEELGDVSRAIDTLENIIQYGESLDDKKINKLFKMKKIIRGE